MQSGISGTARASGADYHRRSVPAYGAGVVGDRHFVEPDGSASHDIHVAGVQTAGGRRPYRERCKIAASTLMRPIAVICACLCPVAVLAQTPPVDSGILLRGGTVHTVSGPVIENGSVLMRNGKIIGGGKNLTAPAGYRVIDITGKEVYPGMIDAASRLGIETNSREEASDAEEIGLINPQLRAVTAVNPSSEQIPAARFNGVTSVIEMPEGELISGQMSIMHLDESGSNSAMTVMPTTAIHLRFPAIVTTPIRPHETGEEDEDPSAEPEPIPYAQAKREYDRKMKALNTFFDEARQYRQAKRANPAALHTDLRYEAILPVLDGAKPMFVTAVKAREIREAVQ